MPETPLTATHRITLPYSVLSFTHYIHAYCKRSDPLVGGPSVANRDGTTLTAWEAAAQGLWDLVKGVLGSSTAPPNALFEQRIGLVWVPLFAATLTGSADSTGADMASQLTAVIRDTAFKKIRVVIMEHSQGYRGHSPNGLGISTRIDNVANGYNGVGFGSHDPYVWQKSRGDNYILASGAVAGITLDMNDKIKRRRGLD